MKQLLITLSFLLPLNLPAQTADLLGHCTLSHFQEEPHAAWYAKNYEAYTPASATVEKLKRAGLPKTTIKVIFGSWCGDSKREVPRFMKLLSAASFPADRVTLIGVDDSLDVYKQSPNREERGLYVYRVPTFIVYENGREKGRIVEYPVESLERDLQRIVETNSYTPNYFSYPLVISWLTDGLLTDPNVSARGLAMRLFGKVQYESELNACGYVLMADGKLPEAVTVFRINANLFPQSANCFDSLGEAYAKSGNTGKAIESYEQALRLAPESENAKLQLKKLRGTP